MQLLPLTPNPAFKYQIVLDGYDFNFRFRWHPAQSIWTFDMVCDDLNLGVKGLALMTGFDLLAGRGVYQVGKLALIDLQGNEDPDFDGLGDRWKLLYITQEEVDAAGT